MVHIIFDERDVPIGWEMRPTTEHEHNVAAIVRNLQFFKMGNERITYNGMELIDPEIGKQIGNIKRLSWMMDNKQKKHDE